MKRRADGFLVAEDFSEHMAPDVRWYEDPAYAEAFADLTFVGVMDRDLEDNPTMEQIMAATTNATNPVTGAPDIFPAFLNIRFEGGNAVVTARGDPVQVEPDEDSEGYTKAGKQVEVTVSQHDWDQFVAEATRERGLVPGG